MCFLCSSLDDSQQFQEEVKELSWITEDISVLYKENSAMIEKIRQLNEDLENFEFEEETFEDVEATDDLWREELTSPEKDIWLQKEGYLRGKLVQQLFTLSQDLFTLQPQQHHPPHHLQHHLPRHLWGHQTFQWRPSSLASTTTARKTKQRGRLLRWLVKRMPKNLIDLQS